MIIVMVALKRINGYARKCQEWTGNDNFYCRQTIKRTFARVSLERKHLKGRVCVGSIAYFLIIRYTFNLELITNYHLIGFKDCSVSMSTQNKSEICYIAEKEVTWVYGEMMHEWLS